LIGLCDTSGETSTTPLCVLHSESALQSETVLQSKGGGLEAASWPREGSVAAAKIANAAAKTTLYLMLHSRHYSRKRCTKIILDFGTLAHNWPMEIILLDGPVRRLRRLPPQESG
jgi:hypothetical protein